MYITYVLKTRENKIIIIFFKYIIYPQQAKIWLIKLALWYDNSKQTFRWKNTFFKKTVFF